MPYKDPRNQREAARRWRKANLEKARESNRKWRAANPEKQRRPGGGMKPTPKRSRAEPPMT